VNLFSTDWKKWGMATKDILDIWDAIRSIREDIEKLKKADQEINPDFLMRSYNSIVERLDAMQKDVDTFKSR
jgi:hypothetical protein